jgi:hypothetical protein
MAETQFTMGADASCTDGVCGEVSRVVVNPIARTVTHLVVEPKHSEGLGRLGPSRPGRRDDGRSPARLHADGVRET